MYERRVAADTVLVCPECKKEDYAIVWDEATKGECYTRDLRRAYVSVIGVRGVRMGTKFNYKCPHCGRFVRGSRIRIKPAQTVVGGTSNAE
jgi:endogenous inhibitor of DNA gyrase (YacG/DUF329 family)